MSRPGPTALHADLPARASQLCEIERQGHLEICMRIIPGKKQFLFMHPRLPSYLELQLDEQDQAMNFEAEVLSLFVFEIFTNQYGG
ncbi:unnamed protein product [Clonostachys solani]|uniref:Uncharacterized protein n=1 Tax=Clonostachys solani TaxID=160281 RepID=A0A9P0EHW5_9HYPO|nr:unnamed protein product [Clonostachys solani]